MPGFFQRLQTAVTPPAEDEIASSCSHRGAQRVQAGTELAGQLGMQISGFANSNVIDLATMIPAKAAQTLVSSYSFFWVEHPREKVIQALQAVISLTQLLALSALFFTSNECADDDNWLCQSTFYLGLLYNATLLTGWSTSELAKKNVDEAANSNARAQAEPPAQV